MIFRTFDVTVYTKSGNCVTLKGQFETKFKDGALSTRNGGPSKLLVIDNDNIEAVTYNVNGTLKNIGYLIWRIFCA